MPLPDLLILLALLGSALVAGTFFGFSTFVMPALSRLPARDGLAAMQSINIAVINPYFLGPFMGTAALSLLAVGYAAYDWHLPRSPFLLAGGICYFVGTFLVTILFNVPLNNALAKLQAADPAAENTWAFYLRRWTLWNHVRTVAGAAAVVLFAFSLRH